MARESPGYRDQLESIITAFPKGERLTVADVAHYTGWSRRVVSRIFPFKELDGIKFITRTTLARLWTSIRWKVLCTPQRGITSSREFQVNNIPVSRISLRKLTRRYRLCGIIFKSIGLLMRWGLLRAGLGRSGNGCAGSSKHWMP